MIKVTIIGGGNVAFHLTNAFLNCSPIQVTQLYNRTIENITCFASSTNITNSIETINSSSDIYFLCINDDQISEFSKKLSLKNKLIVHTSGAKSISEISNSKRKGVFYPVQSFSKNKEINFKNIPICIEATSLNDENILTEVAQYISNSVYSIPSEKRQYIHVAAVFVNNFVNHLYKIGNDICTNNDFSFDILHSLILETANKVLTLNPENSQTGPAKRNDVKTIQHHLKLLTDEQQKLYNVLTDSIKNTYGKKL